MASEHLQALLERNRAYASSNYVAPPDMKTMCLAPRNSVTVIVSCMDPRAIPEQFFGFGRDEMPVIRVAGGRVRSALPQLLIVEDAIGVAEVIIVHHTDCGMAEVTNAQLRGAFKEKCPHKAAELDQMDFSEIAGGDIRASVKSDVRFVKDQPYFNKQLKVSGAIFDVTTGKVEVIEA